jgi:LPS-assembly protein
MFTAAQFSGLPGTLRRAGWLGVLIFVAHSGQAADEGVALASTDQAASGPRGGWSTDLADAYWVPRENLSAGQLDLLPAFCEGMYVPPVFETAADDQVINADADRVEYLVDGTLSLQGNVSVAQGKRRIYGNDANVDELTRDTQFTGGVRLEQSDVVMQSKSALVNLDTNAATFKDVEFLFITNDFRGETDSLIQDEGGNLTMTANSFTRCAPGNNGWQLTTKELEVEKDSIFGEARGAVLRIKDVPVFYLPYLKFPVSDDRQSGLLFPNLRYSGKNGLDLAVPYYLNLAENYDATIVPFVVTKRGAGAEAEFRYLNGWQTASIAGGYLPKDKQFNGTLSKDDWKRAIEAGDPTVPPEFKPADRWLFGLNHKGAAGPFTTDIDYTAVSDRDYFRDLGTELGISSRIDLERTAQVRYARSGFRARLWAQQFQRLDEISVDPYERIPELDLAYQARRVGPFNISIGGKWTSFDRNTEGLRRLEAVTGERFHIEPRVQMPLNWAFGFLNVTGAWRYTDYQLEDDPNNPNPVLVGA